MSKLVYLLLMIFFLNPAWANTHYHQHPVSPLANALRTGTDTNGNALYLCRAKLFNSIQPGKTWAGYGRCNVPYGGKEYVLSQFTIPNQNEFGRYSWEPNVEHALLMGKDTNGNPLFVCQSNFNGSVQPGKTWPGYSHCNISYGGREIITDNYRILSRPTEIIVRTQPPVHRHPSQNRHYHY
ncbi:DUF3421 domain-containing protein [Legionella pneumophila]|uniref:DUF3421 domain-containing protein n=1 Tax=Legionella pneumophila TaxID=446 RepID=UPI0013751494|nr:DUF3421 domain-containing protein [Legionella pneumophila]HAT1936503.1 DUF3421 domain-containing protein [Legionella pneumophila]HAT8709050.1 DUF3421 domain-containing protein [Legionella pneumophila]HAU1244026.1 DUF3421 domain-containing protein [Legionella pneumophila]